MIEDESLEDAPLSEGEKYMALFFTSPEWGVEFKTQVKIRNLKGDSKSDRVADFYLPRYGIYVEFLGQWDVNEDARNRYREKRKVYLKNDIPFIEIYPNQLGILDFAFPYRMRKALNDRGMRKELWKFNFDRWWERISFAGLLLFAFLIFVGWSNDFDNIWNMAASAVLGLWIRKAWKLWNQLAYVT